MFRLRRLYLDSIGVVDNRFSDLMVDLTDRTGAPADSIVWLRNGAGKTTMLSLLLALILPDRRDFLATRTKKRTLEDLVLGSDTAHVVAEWVDPIGQLLLTGAVYEWEGRVRPRDYNGVGKDRLRRTWWCVHPDPAFDRATLDDLPFTLRTEGRYDRERFRAHIRALAAEGVNAVVADQTIAEWHRALRERRFDPELFQYFTEVNAAEGGIDALFAGIGSPGAFVRYLLRFVADRQRIQPVRELLAETAVEIAKRPTYLYEREFCSQAQPLVTELGRAHEKLLAESVVRDEGRAVAAGYKRALLDVAEAADELGKLALQRSEAIEREYKDVRNSGDSARRRRDEYQRLAAQFRVCDAAVALNDVQEQAKRLDLELAAWRAVADFVKLTETQAELEIRKEIFADSAADAGPLVAALDRAKAVLAGALDTALASVDSAISDVGGRIVKQKEAKGTAERQRRHHHDQQAQLDGELESLAQAIARFERDKADAVADGALEESERLDVAVTRLTTAASTANEHVERLTNEQQSLKEQVAGASARCQEDRNTRERAAKRHREVEATLTALDNRAAAIADGSRLRLLLQTDSIDLTVSARDALDLLRQTVAATDSAMVEMRAEMATDERAVRALESGGLLPARPDVDRVVNKLKAVGVVAYPGWRYLAETVRIEDHGDRIAELPEVMDGVIVHGDAGTAAGQIDIEVDDIVVVSAASVFQDHHERRVVLGPAPARHDPAAAEVELARRRDRLTDADQKLRHRGAERQKDTTLAAQIEAWLADLPDDGIDGLRHRVDNLADALGKAAAAENAADNHLAALRERQDEVAGQLGTQKIALAQRKAELDRVRRLDEENRDTIEPATARQSAIPGLIASEREQEEAADTRYQAADRRLDDLRKERLELEGRRRTWATQRAPLPRIATATDLTVGAAESVVRAAEGQLRERFPEASLRDAVNRAEAAVSVAATAWERHATAARERAKELAVTPAGTDPELALGATARVEGELADARETIGSAKAEDAAARAELKAATPRDRPRHTEVEEVPDRAEALRSAAGAHEEAGRIQLKVGQLERDLEGANAEATSADARAGTLRDQALRLRDVDPAPVAVGIVPKDMAEVRARVGTIVGRLDDVEASYGEAMSIRTHCIETLRRWASQDRFALAAEDEQGQAVRRLRELFRGDQLLDRVAGRAAELTADLGMRDRAIGQQLEQVEAHKKNVVQRLADLVDDSLGVLGRASTLSELPAGIGPWEHRRFLVVEARQRPSREQVVLRVGELVDRMVSAGKIEIEPVELLWRATEASVVEGFRATVLKPAPDQPTDRIPVEDMRKWSGGENLTASLVLFCVMARLRAEQRTGSKAGNAGGVVPLDNPLGKANYLPFLELQRRVADASGVQLVFWTGIGDLGAVTAFPRIAAMHKRPSTSRPGRAYVRADPENSFTGEQVVAMVGSVRDEP